MVNYDAEGYADLRSMPFCSDNFKYYVALEKYLYTSGFKVFKILSVGKKKNLFKVDVMANNVNGTSINLQFFIKECWDANEGPDGDRWIEIQNNNREVLCSTTKLY